MYLPADRTGYPCQTDIRRMPRCSYSAVPASPEKFHHGGLVLELKGLTPQQCQALDIGRSQHSYDGINSLLGKGLAVFKIPGNFIEAARAPVGTAGYKQAHPDTGSVGNITVFYGCIIHFFPPSWKPFSQYPICRPGFPVQKTAAAISRGGFQPILFPQIHPDNLPYTFPKPRSDSFGSVPCGQAF